MPEGLGIKLFGVDLIQPGVAGQVRVDQFAQSRPPTSQRPAIIAKSFGGKPREWMQLNALNAEKMLRGGNALKAVRVAQSPSDEVPGMFDFEFYRIDNAVRATLGLGDLNLTLEPELAGSRGNAVTAERILHTDGVAIIFKLVNTLDPDMFETSPPLGPALEIEYVGGGTASAVVATNSGVKTLTLGGGVGQPADAAVMILGDGGFRNFSELAEHINALGSWNATVLYSHHLMPASLTPDGALTFTTGKTKILLGKTAQIQWLLGSGIARASAVAGAATGVGAGAIPFSGGAEGTADTQAYLDAINSALNRDVQSIWTDSEDIAVQTALERHCTVASHPVTQRRRRCFIGPALAVSKAQQATDVVTLAKSLGKLATVVGTPLKWVNPASGLVETLSPNYVAAMILGMDASATPDIDLTFKTMKTLGLHWEYSKEEIDAFIKAGALAVKYDWDDKVFRIADDVTAYQVDNNLYNRVRYGVRIQHYLAKKIELRMKKFIGKTGDSTIIYQIRDEADLALSEEVRTTNNNGVLVGYDPSQVIFDGIETAKLRCGAYGVGRIGFIPYELDIKPLAITV